MSTQNPPPLPRIGGLRCAGDRVVRGYARSIGNWKNMGFKRKFRRDFLGVSWSGGVSFRGVSFRGLTDKCDDVEWRGDIHHNKVVHQTCLSWPASAELPFLHTDKLWPIQSTGHTSVG